jgi:hypothetical protein
MKGFIACANGEEKSCLNRRKCIENGVVCVHLIVGFEKEAKPSEVA